MKIVAEQMTIHRGSCGNRLRYGVILETVVNYYKGGETRWLFFYLGGSIHFQSLVP